MSDNALKTVRREDLMAGAVKDFVKKHFPEFALSGIDVGPGPKPLKKMPTPDEVAYELVKTLFPELDGDFTPSAQNKRSIATIVAKKWAHKLAAEFLDGMNAAEDHVERQTELLKIARDTLLAQDAKIKDLQSETRQAIELRGVHADKAKDELQTKLANAERLHLSDQQLLQAAIRERDEARGELVVFGGKMMGLERDLGNLMKAVSGNAKAPKEADAYLAAAVEKCHEFWGENARRSPTAQLVLGDIIKARVALQPLTLVAAKPAQEKTA